MAQEHQPKLVLDADRAHILVLCLARHQLVEVLVLVLRDGGCLQLFLIVLLSLPVADAGKAAGNSMVGNVHLLAENTRTIVLAVDGEIGQTNAPPPECVFVVTVESFGQPESDARAAEAEVVSTVIFAEYFRLLSFKFALVPQLRLRLAFLADLWLRVELLVVFLTKLVGIICLLIIILQISKLFVGLIELRVVRLFFFVAGNVLELLKNSFIFLGRALVKAFAEIVADNNNALGLVMDVPVVDRPMRVDNIKTDVLPSLENLLTTEVETAAAVEEEQSLEKAAFVRVGQFVEFRADVAVRKDRHNGELDFVCL
jgi:hypothetical protein